MPAAALSPAGENGAGAAKSGTAKFGAAKFAARHIDFILLALALPVFVAASWPLAGYAVAAAVWCGQAALLSWLEAKATASRNPRTIAGLLVGGSIARAWIAAIAILTTGLAIGDAAGLACALLLMALFTAYFANKMIVHYVRPAAAQ